MTKMGLKGRVKPVTRGRGDMLDRAKLSLDAGRVVGSGTDDSTGSKRIVNWSESDWNCRWRECSTLDTSESSYFAPLNTSELDY